LFSWSHEPRKEPRTPRGLCLPVLIRVKSPSSPVMEGSARVSPAAPGGGAACDGRGKRLNPRQGTDGGSRAAAARWRGGRGRARTEYGQPTRSAERPAAARRRRSRGGAGRELPLPATAHPYGCAAACWGVSPTARASSEAPRARALALPSRLRAVQRERANVFIPHRRGPARDARDAHGTELLDS